MEKETIRPTKIQQAERIWKQYMLPLLSTYTSSELANIEHYIVQEMNCLIIEKQKEENEYAVQSALDNVEKNSGVEDLFENIRLCLRSLVIQNRHMLTENYFYPNDNESLAAVKQFEGYTEKNTADVDEFLFPDEEDVNELCNMGILSHGYCMDCGSRNIGNTKFISHSLGRRDLDFIFSEQVLGKDLSNMVICDVGSRLGSILYYAYLFTNAKQIIGIENNENFFNLQTYILQKFDIKYDDNENIVKMQNEDNDDKSRIIILNKDFMECPEISRQCDILIMHNVFEWFYSQQEHRNIWLKIRFGNYFKKGAILLTCPSIRQSLNDCGLDAHDIELDSWLTTLELDRSDYILEEERQEPSFSEEHSIHMYKVL